LVPAVLALLCSSLLLGCEGKTRYQVLSFFFDGVPLPEAPKIEPIEDPQKKSVQMASVYIEHGPYGAKQCGACHQSGSNNLVLPIKELCFKCHALDLRKKNLHGPLASGGCKICHNPHGSRYPFLLVAEPKEFCLYCHDREDIARNPVHAGMNGAQCTECHDAHGSDNEYLLRQVSQYYKGVPGKNGRLKVSSRK
jgi:predicted CXXCH cytochrome family protein